MAFSRTVQNGHMPLDPYLCYLTFQSFECYGVLLLLFQPPLLTPSAIVIAMHLPPPRQTPAHACGETNIIDFYVALLVLQEHNQWSQTKSEVASEYNLEH